MATVDSKFYRIGRLRSNLYAFKELFKSPFTVSCIEVASTFAGIRDIISKQGSSLNRVRRLGNTRRILALIYICSNVATVAGMVY